MFLHAYGHRDNDTCTRSNSVVVGELQHTGLSSSGRCSSAMHLAFGPLRPPLKASSTSLSSPPARSSHPHPQPQQCNNLDCSHTMQFRNTRLETLSGKPLSMIHCSTISTLLQQLFCHLFKYIFDNLPTDGALRTFNSQPASPPWIQARHPRKRVAAFKGRPRVP